MLEGKELTASNCVQQHQHGALKFYMGIMRTIIRQALHSLKRVLGFLSSAYQRVQECLVYIASDY